MSEQRPRSPGLVFTVIAVVLAVLVGIVALSARQPPPPTIAEFAPQAAEQIEDSPDDQTSSSGRGVGAGGGEVTPSPTPPPADAVTVPRVRKCIGDPPRQIEDPQSPPCVPFWTGDNRGSTSKGVTRNEIRIAQPTSDAPATITDQLAQFFNKRFEFYGRSLKVLPPIRSDIGNAAPATQKADAAQADSQNVFASLYYRNSDGLPYRTELARRKVLSMGIYVPMEHDFLASYRPYMWQYALEADRIFDTMGAWACKRLAGRGASHAGGDLAGKPRVFGIMMQTPFDDDPTDTQALEAALAQCGVKAALKRRNAVGGVGSSVAPVEPTSAQNVAIQFKNAGVTSILCTCYFFAFGAVSSAAIGQSYFPEWLTSSYSLDINANFTLSAARPEQLSHTFGIVSIPRQVRADREPYWEALREIDPNARDDNNEVSVAYRVQEYRNMLLFASGIQMAGPKLTPETFEAALHRTRFPNPQHPLMAGAAGFGRQAHAMTTDSAEVWWSTDTRGPYQGDDNGTLCYVAGGARYTRDTWPTDGTDPFFAGSCDVG